MPRRFEPFDPRHLPVGRPDDVCYLSLSDRIECCAVLDRIDYEWATTAFKSPLWCHTYGSGSMCPERGVMDRPNHIYARKSVGGKTVFLHRLVCRRAHGEPPTLLHTMADHMNGDTLDCRRRNLQWATPTMNALNIRGSVTREEYERTVDRVRAAP